MSSDDLDFNAEDEVHDDMRSLCVEVVCNGSLNSDVRFIDDRPGSPCME